MFLLPKPTMEPKSKTSNAAVPVQRHVIERIHALKLKTVYVRAGRAVRKYKAVKSDGPTDIYHSWV
jgi:hypothetical protein